MAARQLASQRWWDIRDSYDIFVSQIVVDECAAVRAFQALLMQEREALVHGQTECIEHLSVEKAQLAQALECATRAREQAISNGFGSADEDALTRWLVEDPAAPALWRSPY